MENLEDLEDLINGYVHKKFNRHQKYHTDSDCIFGIKKVLIYTHSDSDIKENENKTR